MITTAELTLSRLITQHPVQIPPDQWADIAQAALLNGLAPMFIWTIHQTQPLLLSEIAFQPLLKEAQHVAFHSVQLEALQADIQSVLATRGIPCVWLKGIALSQTIYPASDLRPMSDIDVLVPFEQREEALAALHVAGYHDESASASPLAELPLMTHHHYRLVKTYQRGIVELHYRLSSASNTLLPKAGEDWICSQTQRSPQGWFMLAPEAQLLHLCIHNVLVHYDRNVPLVRYLDIDLLLRNAPLDWDVVLDKAEEFGCSSALAYTLEKVSRLFATPIPDTVRQQLSTLKASDLRQLNRRGATAAGALRLFHGLSLRHQFALVRWFLLPPPVYMRRRYAQHARLPLWALYPIRWSKQAADIADLVYTRIAKRRASSPF